MRIALEIVNVYEDGDEVTTHVTADVTAPPADFTARYAAGDEELHDWAYEQLYPHTGTGQVTGNSAYFVTVTASDDPALVGTAFEFGT